MTNPATEYAKELAALLLEVSAAQDRAKDVVASAKDAGINVKVLRKLAKEINMDTEKRKQLYADEDQMDMFRFELKLVPGLSRTYQEAAE